MDRIYLIVTCTSIILLTTAFGFASPQADGVHSGQHVPLLLRTLRADLQGLSWGTVFFKGSNAGNGNITFAQCLQQADARTYLRIGSVERGCDDVAVAVETQHFKKLSVFVSGPVAVH